MIKKVYAKTKCLHLFKILIKASFSNIYSNFKQMKIITLLAALLIVGSLSAQSNGKHHPITQETFKVQLQLEKNKRIKVLNFVSAKGKRLNAEVSNPGDIPWNKLKAGSIIAGEFRFTSFSSDGGLGGTRIVKGEGKGYMKVARVTIDDQLVLASTSLAGVGDLAFRLK